MAYLAFYRLPLSGSARRWESLRSNRPFEFAGLAEWRLPGNDLEGGLRGDKVSSPGGKVAARAVEGINDSNLYDTRHPAELLPRSALADDQSCFAPSTAPRRWSLHDSLAGLTAIRSGNSSVKLLLWKVIRESPKFDG